MNISTLRQYMDVCEQLSFSKAADLNYISRQSLTKAMTKLEHELDTTLFVRHRSGITLTKEGEYFYDALKGLLPLWISAVDGIHTIHRDSRIIHVAATLALLSDDTICRLLENDFIANGKTLVFHDASTNQCIEKLNAGEVDVAYTINARDDSKDLVFSPITSHLEGTYLLVGKDSALAQHPSITKDCLKGEAIQYPDIKSISGARLNEYIREAGARFVHAPNMHNVQIQLVERGVGSLVIPASALAEFASPKIVAKRIVDIPSPRVYTTKKEHPSIVRRRDCSKVVQETSLFLYSFFSSALYEVDFKEDENGTITFF